MPNRDLILLETVKTHRARLTSAFVHGALPERRVTNDNLRRLIGSVVLAAVVCAGCVGFSFVSSLLGRQAASQRAEAAQGPATGPVAVSDAFDRTVDGGWGRAETGGRWSTAGPRADYAVSAGDAVIDLGSRPRGGYLPGVSLDHTDLQLTLRRTTGARRGTVTVSVEGRRISSQQDYRAVTQLRPNGSVAVSLLRDARPAQVTGSAEGGSLQLSPTISLFGRPDQSDQSDQTDQSVQPITVRLQVVGTAPTTLRVKVWQGASAEPANWALTATDDTAELQRPGSLGLAAVSSGSSPPARLAVSGLLARVAP